MNKKIVATVFCLANSVAWGAQQPVGLCITFGDLLSNNVDERWVRATDSRELEEAAKVAAISGPNSVVVAHSKQFQPSKVMLEILEMKNGEKVARQCPLESLITYQKHGPSVFTDPVRAEALAKTFIQCFFKGNFKDTANFGATACCGRRRHPLLRLRP